MRCKVPQYTYNMEEDIASTSVVEARLKLHGFHVDAIHPKPPTPVNPITVKTAYPKLQLKDGFVSEEQLNFFSSTSPRPTWTGVRRTSWGHP